MPVKEMKVYVASCWWRDCDPFIRIIGNDTEIVRKAAQSAMEDEAQRASDDSDDEGDSQEFYLDSIAWSGVHSMNLRDVIADYEIPSLEPDYTQLVSRDKVAILYVS